MKDGKAVWIEGMDKKVQQGEQPEKISRFVQYNAANKNFDFKFSDEQRQQHNQNRQAKQGEKTGEDQKVPKARKIGEVWVYSKQAGVQLSVKILRSCATKSLYFSMAWNHKTPKQQADASGRRK